MKLCSLRLVNFRSFTEKTLECGPGLNVIVGPNGVGKSNLLEAIYLLIVGRSFRTNQLKDLIRSGADAFFVEGVVEKGGSRRTLRYGFDGERRRITVNDTLCQTTAQLLGHLQGSLIAPSDEKLVSGAPQTRRHYLDMQMAQIDPLYVFHLTRYHCAYRQRNALLRQRKSAAIESWEEEMARSGAYLRFFRENLVKTLSSRAATIFSSLHEKEVPLTLSYHGDPPLTSIEQLEMAYRAMMESQRPREFDRGTTLVGPHKDDLKILYGGESSKVFASEGQKRLIVGALKVAEWECIAARTEGTPLMLADDIGISLDRTHKGNLLGNLSDMGQVFATTPELTGEERGDPVIHDLADNQVVNGV